MFHSGTKRQAGEIVTSGGRVLSVTAIGATLAQARERAYQAVAKIRFEGMQVRTDIGNVIEKKSEPGAPRAHVRSGKKKAMSPGS